MANAATADLVTPEVDIDLIHVVDGHNSRNWTNEEALRKLAANIGRNGMIEPLPVVPVEDHFELLAGERRLRAARIAGLKKVPISPRQDGNRSDIAAAENDHREDLDPVATARSWKAVAEEHNLTTNAAIADHLDEDVKAVGAHLRLLKLPVGVQHYIAEGIVPVEGERPLREISRVSPRVAECVCELASRRKIKPTRFVSGFGDLLAETAEARFDDRPTMIPVPRVTIAQAVADREGRENIRARLAGVFPDETVDTDSAFLLADEEIDAARAAGCLIEFRRGTEEWIQPIRFITDAEFAADLTDRVVGRLEVEVPEGRRRREEQERRAKATRQGADPDADAEKQAEQRKEQVAERKKKKADAFASNDEVGRLLLKGRGGRSRKQRSMNRYRVITGLLLAAYPELAAGLRLVLPQLRNVEVKQLKSGESREKITYAKVHEATEYLANRLAEVDSPEEGNELIADAVVAAILADDEVLTQADRVGSRFHIDTATREALAADVKAATPRKAGGKK